MSKNKNYGVQLGRAFTHNAVWQKGALIERVFYWSGYVIGRNAGTKSAIWRWMGSIAVYEKI